MTANVKTLLSAANESVPKISPAEARSLLESGEAVAVDVRDSAEIKSSGKVPGALAISRGMIEFKADPESPYFEPMLSKEKPIIVYCASGGRAALAGKTLKDFGYETVFNLGGFKTWTEAGNKVEQVD